MCFEWLSWKYDAENVILGSQFWNPGWSNLIEILVVFLTILFLRFAWFLNELRNAMFLQESEKVNISRDVEQNFEIHMN